MLHLQLLPVCSDSEDAEMDRQLFRLPIPDRICRCFDQHHRVVVVGNANDCSFCRVVVAVLLFPVDYVFVGVFGWVVVRCPVYCCPENSCLGSDLLDWDFDFVHLSWMLTVARMNSMDDVSGWAFWACVVFLSSCVVSEKYLGGQ